MYHLVENGVLERIGRGVFKLGRKSIFKPHIDSEHVELVKSLRSNFPYSEFCIWNTKIINEFMLHQPFRFLTMIEVDKDSMQSVFNRLKEDEFNAFVNPGREVMEYYIQDVEDPIVVKPLVTEAPIQVVNDIPTTTIEKLLVDLLSDKKLYTAYQGAELKYIFEEVYNKYTINEKALLRYASRRKRREELKNYLNKLDLLMINQRDRA